MYISVLAVPTVRRIWRGAADVWFAHPKHKRVGENQKLIALRGRRFAASFPVLAPQAMVSPGARAR